MFEETLIPTSGPAAGFRNLSRWDEIALEEIDDAFFEAFGNYETSTVRIGTPTTEYRNALVAYENLCVEIAQNVCKRGREASKPPDTTLEEDVKRALKWNGMSIPLPFPTFSFVAWTFHLFKSLQHAINEVSIAFSSAPSIADVERSHPRSS